MTATRPEIANIKQSMPDTDAIQHNRDGADHDRNRAGNRAAIDFFAAVQDNQGDVQCIVSVNLAKDYFQDELDSATRYWLPREPACRP
jgi:hypothetical protein